MSKTLRWEVCVESRHEWVELDEIREFMRGYMVGSVSVCSARDRFRNVRVNRRRAPVERVFAVLKRVFDGGHVLVTTVPRVHVKMTFACLCFNLLQLGTLGGAW